MLLNRATLEGIAAGRITLAFRRWKRPTVKAGGTLHTPVGLLAIDAVDAVGENEVTRQAARRAGFDTAAELRASLGNRSGTLYRIAFRRAGDDPRIALRADDRLSDAERADLQARLARLDARSPSGPWTTVILERIAGNPGVRAADLAAKLGCDKEPLKRNIRKLKNLGLTESLEVGYRLSPRGRAFIARR